MKTIRASLAVSTVFLCCSLCFRLPVTVASIGSRDSQEAYCVFEKIDAHSPQSHVISRTDWLSVARCREAAFLAPRWQRAPENPPSSNMTYMEAAALMDAMRLSFGAPGPSDRFHQRCDRSHTVWMRPGSNPPQRAFTHIDWGTENAGAGFVVESTHLCCEDAAMLVSVTPGSDCRAFDLVSTPGRVARTTGGWVSLTGASLTVALPNKPPITIPAAAAGGVAGKYVVKFKGFSPQCPADGQQFFKNLTFEWIVTQSGNQLSFRLGRYSNDNGGTWIASTDSKTYTLTLNSDGTFRYADKTWTNVGRFLTGGRVEMETLDGKGCSISFTGIKTP